tara:strand:- start:1269 stop:1817 length:549 start_codon:yes stop_codon:yes gene_type:complete
MKNLKRISQEKFDSLKKDEKDLLLIYYNTYEKENKLSKSLTKSRKKTKKIKERLNNVQIKKKEIMEKIKSINKSLFTSSTIVWDKRWNSYICIFKNSDSQKSLYLGNHKSIIQALTPFYSKEEFKESQEFLKEELKKIISAVQDKLIKHNDNNEITLKKNKLKSIVELYAESGRWDYWSIEN